MRRLSVLFLLAAVLVAGCGFHLRGTFSGQLPYKTIYVNLPENSDLGISLRRYIASLPTTKLANSAKEAEAVFEQVADRREKAILSVNAQGQVREYRLQANYSFRIVDSTGRELVPVNEINLMRDITFSDANILAKDQEEALLWRDINTDLVSQILRRLSIVKPKPPGSNE